MVLCCVFTLISGDTASGGAMMDENRPRLPVKAEAVFQSKSKGS